jgi:DNA-binding GntR family transcriptional regulator
VPEPKRHEHAHGLTIAAQLAAMLRARARPEELAPSRLIPSEPTLTQQYGVTRQAGSGTASAAAAWVLAM